MTVVASGQADEVQTMEAVLDTGRADRGVPVRLNTPSGVVHAWWHEPVVSARGITVLHWPGFGLEQSRDYRAARQWCAQLARYGYGALRLTWPGTGFNGGDLGDRHPLDLLDAAVAAAIAWRLTAMPDERLVLAARRGGALIAAAQLTHSSVIGAIWWTPAISGRHYVRELQAYGRLQRESDPRALTDQFDGIEVGGYRLPRHFATTLGGLDLVTRTGTSARPTLLISAPGIEPTIEQLQALSEHASVRTVLDVDAAIPMDDWTKVVEPGAATHASIEFLRALAAATDAARDAPSDEPRMSASAVPHRRAGARNGRNADASSLRTEVVRLGARYDMVAMHAKPSAPATGVGILLLGNGTDPVSGAHDLNARLATAWAGHGHTVWSLTLPGIGDSLAPLGARDQDDYPSFGVDAIRDAVEAIRASGTIQRLAIAGICSGGWYALHAAAAGVPVELVLAGNPPLYYDGTPARREELERLCAEGGRLEGSDGRVHPWRALLTPSSRALAVAYLRRRLRVTRIPAGSMHHPWRDTLQRLHGGTVPVTVVYGRRDVGFRPLVWAGYLPAIGTTHRRGALRFEITDGTDHQFTGPAEAPLRGAWDAAIARLASSDA